MTLEEVLKITFNKIINNDEQVYILTKEMLDETNVTNILNQIQILNMSNNNYIYFMLQKDIEFIMEQDNFAIIFRPFYRITGKEWLPCLAYLYNGAWVRVIINYAKCSKCDWEGSVANPTDTDLYVTMKNRFSILNKIYELPFLKCPLCDSDISAKAIWINRSETGGILR